MWWAWVIIGLAGAVVLAVLVLSVPLNTRIAFDSSSPRKVRVRLTWLFGLISLEPGPREQKKALPPAGRHRKRKRAGGNLGRMWRMAGNRGLAAEIKKLLSRTVGRLKITELAVRLTVGFDDPADGGMVFAMVGAARPFLRLPAGHELVIQPCLSDHPFIKGQAHCVVRLQPIRLVPPLARFIFSAPARKALGEMAFHRR